VRMSYRVINGKPLLPNTGQYLDENAAQKRLSLEIELIKRSTIISLDNVAEFYAQHEQQVWSVGDHPNQSPPFRSMFFEFKEPKTFYINNEWVESGDPSAMHGILCLSADVTDETRSDTNVWLKLISGFSGADMSHSRSRVSKALINSRWLIMMDHWFSSSKKPLSGSAIRAVGKCWDKESTPHLPWPLLYLHRRAPSVWKAHWNILDTSARSRKRKERRYSKGI